MKTEQQLTLVEPMPQATPPAVTPMAMIQIAIEKGATVDQLERLMALQERYEANEARKAFVAAKAAFYAEAPTITKNKHVGFTSRRTGGDTDYWHATLDHVVAMAAPVLAKHGLTHSWSTSQDEKGVEVSCILRHTMGHEERVSLKGAPEMSGTKNAIQGIGSTITFLERYTFLAVTGLAAKNQDDDGGRINADFITEEQMMELETLFEDVGGDKKAFLEYFHADTFAMIAARDFDRAKAALLKKRQKAAEK